MKTIDLRSDTVTQPTPEMRRAMFEAVVGDDVYGEDPTVHRLEEESAALLGKEAALFVPTGTQGNQIAVLTHCGRGQEVIVEADSHLFFYEAGGIAALAGCQPFPLRGVRGMLAPDQVEDAIRADNIHFPHTGLVCLENTHNRAGGTVVTASVVKTVADAAHHHGVPVHLDGARLFNAAIALGCAASELVAEVDSVMFCLSKGLGAPVGSVLAGSREFIGKARRNRKLLGGGMRQAGILAAAGLVALDTMIERLAEDHQNARRLAAGLENLPGLNVPEGTVQTNMVLVEITDGPWDGAGLAAALSKYGVLCHAVGRNRVRLVTHKDVLADDVADALERIREVVRSP